MTTFEMITVKLDSGEQITMTANDVQWFSRDGLCIGHAAMEEFLEFLKEKLEDVQLDASREHGMDAEDAEAGQSPDYPTEFT